MGSKINHYIFEVMRNITRRGRRDYKNPAVLNSFTKRCIFLSAVLVVSFTNLAYIDPSLFYLKRDYVINTKLRDFHKKEGHYESKITKFAEGKVQDGFILYNPKGVSGAYLIDRKGQRVHAWINPNFKKWHHVDMDKSGNLYIVSQEGGIAKLNWESEILWSIFGDFHHDIYIDEEGNILALKSVPAIIKYKGKDLRFLTDEITMITPEGADVGNISLLEFFKGNIPLERLEQVYKFDNNQEDAVDPEYYQMTELEKKEFEKNLRSAFHANSIEVLKRDVPGVFNKGQLLLSLRNISTVVVFDSARHEIVWSWGPGEIEEQHDAVLLDSNQIMLFDNGVNRKWSRVIKVDPHSKKIDWEYSDQDDPVFYSHARGGSQPLPNGNILVTDSIIGRIFEITPRKEIVWEYFFDYGTSIYRAQYIPKEIGDKIIKKNRKGFKH